MAKQSNQKLKLLYLLRILLEQTDENSGLTISQLSSELAKYNVAAARKSLYDDIESLRVFGINVCVKRDRYVRYYIAKRDLSPSELKYAIDALGEFSAIPQSASYELMQKLARIYGGTGKGSGYTVSLYEPIYKTPKAVYDELAKSVEALNCAITSGKKVYFKHFEWNAQKQRTLMEGGKRFFVTPIRLECDKKYILHAFDGKSIVAFDVDTLIDVEASNADAAPIEEYKSLLEAQKFNNGYDGEYENLRLEVANSFAGEIFRKFGLGVTVLSNREDVFEISVKARLNGDFFSWIFSNAKQVRIVAPDRAIDLYKDMLLLALDNTNKK